MKKSLSKILARMARDGDIETVAEIIEEMIEPEDAAEGTEVVVVEAPQGEETETAAEAQVPENGAAVENAETAVVVDEPTLGDVIARLDQIIALLTPAAADADPVEEIAEAVEEAIEAVAGVEEIAAVPEGAEEVAEVIEEILEPDEGLVLPEETESTGDGCGNEQEVISTGDALRAALKPMRPVLAKMPKAQRDMICADIAARLNGKPVSRKGVYGAMNDAARKRSAAGPDLGRRIMERRNPNYKN